MADGGAEVRPPFRLALVGVGARIDQDLDPAARAARSTAHPHAHAPRSTGTRAGRDRSGTRSRPRAADHARKQDHAGVSETIAQRRRPASPRLRAVCKPSPEQRSEISPPLARPPAAGAKQGGARSEKGGARIGFGVVEQQARPWSASPCRGGRRARRASPREHRSLRRCAARNRYPKGSLQLRLRLPPREAARARRYGSCSPVPDSDRSRTSADEPRVEAPPRRPPASPRSRRSTERRSRPRTGRLPRR